VSAFVTLFAVELGLLTFGLTVGFTTDVGVVVLVVGVVVVLFVTVEVIGEVVEPLPVVIVGRAPPPVGAVPEVIEPEVRPVKDGRSLKLRMTLSSGARSSPLASGSLLLDVRFFRIAMSYPVFFTNEVRPAILLTGLNFAVFANVFAGCIGVAF